MKQTSSALTFLLAQYRAIFKRAYIKGIASAVILTAGLAAGQAQAQPDGTFYENTGSWIEKTSPIPSSTNNATAVAGDYADADRNNGQVSSGNLVIGDSGTAIGGDIESLTSGSAYGGYVKLSSGSLDVVAEDNKVTISSGATLNSSAGNVMGGWAKTNGTGTATASGNKLIINSQSGSTITFTGINTLVGGGAGGNHGAKAEDNKYTFNGNATTPTDLTSVSGGHRGGMVFVGDVATSGSSGAYEAIGNTLQMSNFVISGDSVGTGPKTFRGGDIYVYNVEADNTIDVIRAQGNTVDLDSFTLGSGSYSTNYGVTNIAANYVDNSKGYVASVEANGSGDTGVFLNEGKLYQATVFGGMAKNVSGGNASASNNLVSITNTDFLRTTSGSTINFNGIFGGHAETTKTDADQKINLTASNNAISIQNESDVKNKTYQVEGSIIGAELKLLSGSSGITDLVGSTLTADNNTITIDAGIKVSNGSIQGVSIDTDQSKFTSGGATLHASNNTVTLDGDWTTEESKYNIATVIAQKGVLTAENNKLIINGKVDASAAGSIIAAVIASEQGTISGKLEAGKNVHNLSNNSIEIGADAEVIRANIFAAQSTQTSAHTLNNDVTVAGKVTNSDIYGGTGADSVVATQAGSLLRYNDDVNHQIRSDVVDLAGIVDVGQTATLKVGGFLTDGNINAGTYNTNQTTIKSTAELYNHKEVELLGDTTVEAGAKLHALTAGAKIKVNGDVGGSTIKTTNTLGYDFVGGRGQLTISKAQLQSYLTAGDNYTLDSTTSGTDKAGTVEVTSGGVLEFTDSNIDLATLDYTTTDEAGKIKVGTDSGSSILKGDAVTISHALAGNGTKFADGTYTLNKDGKFGDDYGVLSGAAITTTGVSIEANDLILGSSRISGEQSKDITFEKATAKDSITAPLLVMLT